MTSAFLPNTNQEADSYPTVSYNRLVIMLFYPFFRQIRALTTSCAVVSLIIISFAVVGPFTANAYPVLGKKGNIAKVKRYPTIALSEYQTSQEDIQLPAQLKSISAKSAIILDAAADRVLFARNANDPRQPASTIKVLTGIIALNALTGKEAVPVSREAASRPSSKMYLDPAKRYRADELISGVLLGSANDASVALAELLAGSEPAFTDFMNLQARHFGATNTDCKTATGLTAKNQTSTASDLALIFREAMRDEAFASRMKIRVITTDEGNKVYNHNKALWRINGAEGGKTGYTNAARQTYVGKFSNGDASIIVAIMGSETMWHDLKQLVNFGYSQYRPVDLILPDHDKEPLLADNLAGEKPPES